MAGLEGIGDHEGLREEEQGAEEWAWVEGQVQRKGLGLHGPFLPRGC